MKFWDTLTGRKRDFHSLIDGKVGMYNCGPTVYDYAHIGNLRSFILADLIRRTLEWSNFKVKQVMNITDIGLLTNNDSGEDKMVLALKREGKPLTLEAMKELGNFYTERFLENLHELNIEIPHHIVKASEHINEQVALIQKLEEKDFTYKTSDGIYFDTSKFENYGKLGNIDIQGLKEGARIHANAEKKSLTDFALWKFNQNFGFESPLGKGFPGWHIECSAMSMKYLGESFDIHTGGIDLIPTHHNNEIAQSESATGKPYVRYWLHNAFVNIGSDKMSKSEGNFITLQTLKEKGIHPLSYRYLLLGAHYRTPLEFSWDALLGAQRALENIVRYVAQIKESGAIDSNYQTSFKNFVDDDLDTPRALSILHEVIADKNLPLGNKKSTLLEFDKVLGLNLQSLADKIKNIPQNIIELGEQRDVCRKDKNWMESDKIRALIESQEFIVEDSTEKTVIKRKITPEM